MKVQLLEDNEEEENLNEEAESIDSNKAEMYNKKVFDAFERHGVTPHIVNFRHRYFWDGGLHCITSDIAREGGVRNDYFPERGNKNMSIMTYKRKLKFKQWTNKL